MPQQNVHDKMSFGPIFIVLYDVLTILCLSNYSQICHYVIITPQPLGLWVWDTPRASLGVLGPRPVGLRPSGAQGGPLGVPNP